MFMCYIQRMKTCKPHPISGLVGLYRRVAEKCGVDPSYVSRIARGERRSPKIELFLNHEIQRILASVSRPASRRKVK
jgi:transcriptional regulator with XRE-family HTH domain